MNRRVWIYSLSLLIFLFSSNIAFAHVGGGPPFVKVNHKYCPNNPYYQGESTINIPQDIAPDVYLQNKPISFEVDLDKLVNQLSITSDFINSITFRWSFLDGENLDKQISNIYQYGKTTTYTFPKPKTYLVAIEAKAPTDPEYITIDTVKVDVVPFQGYKLPKISIAIGSDDFSNQTPVLFVSKSKFDPSVSHPMYLWGFAENKIQRGVSIEHSFAAMTSPSLTYVYHRIIDDNGLMSDMGFSIDYIKNKLTFIPFGNMTSVPITIGTREQAKKLQEQQTKIGNISLQLPILVGTIGIIGFLFFFLGNEIRFEANRS